MSDTKKMSWLVCALFKLVKICQLTSVNLHFVPQQDGAEGWITASLFSRCTHTTSYPCTRAPELFSCLYLWGKQALLRAAPVWSIIKYNATWKCIRNETRVWTSHSDFLLVIHFVLVRMLTAALFLCVCVCLFLFAVLFQPCAHCNALFSFAWLLCKSVVLNVCYSSWHLEFNKIMSCLIMLLLSGCSLSTLCYTQ